LTWVGEAIEVTKTQAFTTEETEITEYSYSFLFFDTQAAQLKAERDLEQNTRKEKLR
jgi:hypothetical protein